MNYLCSDQYAIAYMLGSHLSGRLKYVNDYFYSAFSQICCDNTRGIYMGFLNLGLGP